MSHAFSVSGWHLRDQNQEETVWRLGSVAVPLIVQTLWSVPRWINGWVDSLRPWPFAFVAVEDPEQLQSQELCFKKAKVQARAPGRRHSWSYLVMDVGMVDVGSCESYCICKTLKCIRTKQFYLLIYIIYIYIYIKKFSEKSGTLVLNSGRSINKSIEFQVPGWVSRNRSLILSTFHRTKRGEVKAGSGRPQGAKARDQDITLRERWEEKEQYVSFVFFC